MAEEGEDSSTATSGLTPKRSHSVDTQASSKSKRLRLDSEDDSVLIVAVAEADPPELTVEGVTMHNVDEGFVAVETVDAPARDHIRVYDKFQLDVANTTNYLPVETFAEVVTIMLHHVERLQSRSVDQRKYVTEVYMQDLGRLGKLLIDLLDIDNPFERTVYAKERAALTVALNSFCESLVVLAYNITALLTKMSDYKMAPVSASELDQMLAWISLAARISHTSGPFLQDVYNKHGAEAEVTKAVVANAYTTIHDLTDRFDALLLALLHCEDHNPNTLLSVLSLIQLCYSPYYIHSKRGAIAQSSLALRTVSDVLSSFDSSFIKVLTHNNPRSLPGGFHEAALSVLDRYLLEARQYLDANALASIAALGTQRIAVVQDDITGRGLNKSEIHSQQARLSWTTKLAVAYLKADFMSLRTIGAHRLGMIVENVRKACNKKDVSSDYCAAVLRHALQQLDVVPYLFGPQSHNILLGNCQELILFVVHFGGWTTELADHIWHACLTNSEDEFLKKAFGILFLICDILTAPQLLYLVDKFGNTAPEDITLYAVQLFQHLLLKLCSISDQSWRSQATMSCTMELCFDILSRYLQTKHDATITYLCEVALQHILSPLVQSDRALEGQAVCQRCTGLITQCLPEAGVAFVILKVYLSDLAQKDIPVETVCTLTLREVVEELGVWLTRVASGKSALAGIQPRLEVVAAMVTLQPEDQSSPDLEDQFWEVVTSNTIDARSQQAILNTILAGTAQSSRAWNDFVTRRMDKILPTLESTTATGAIRAYLRDQAMAIPANDVPHQSYWSHLLRLTLGVTDSDGWRHAMDCLCMVLLQKSTDPGRTYRDLVRLQQTFVQHRLTELATIPRETRSQKDQWVIVRTFQMLSILLNKDKDGGVIEGALVHNYSLLEPMLHGADNLAEQAWKVVSDLPVASDRNEDVLELNSSSLADCLITQPWRICHVAQLTKAKLSTDRHDDVVRTCRTFIELMLHCSQEMRYDTLYWLANTTVACLAKVFTLDTQDGHTLPTEQLKALCKNMIQLLCCKAKAGEVQTSASQECPPLTLIELHKVIVKACQVYEPAWHVLIQDESFTIMNKQLLCRHHQSFFQCYSQELISDLKMAPYEVMFAHIQVMVDMLESCKGRPGTAKAATDIIKELLARYTEQLILSDASDLWLSTVIQVINNWQHCETTYNRLPDHPLLHIFQAASAIAACLKASGRQLPVGFADTLWNTFLFPKPSALTAASTRPLISRDSRYACYELMLILCEDVTQHLQQLAALQEWLYPTLTEGMQNLSDDWQRDACMPAGLTNLGMTCYMNSLLQQIFGNLSLRKQILELSILDHEKQKLLVAVQRLFTKMQDSMERVVGTNELAMIMQISTNIQDDVHGFFSIFMAALEDNAATSHEKAQLRKIYSGKSISQVRGACNHISSSVEDLSGLSITVQGKASLEDSLSEYFSQERLRGDNRYKCMTCEPEAGRLVEAAKRTTLSEVPDMLIFCLKRCGYTSTGLESKNNDAFDFPHYLDMAPYQYKLESPAGKRNHDPFTLVGVVVHSGTLEYGHYWSYVRNRAQPSLEDSIWLRLEDSRVSHSTDEAMREECIGGGKLSSSAYMLIYERRQTDQNISALKEPDTPEHHWANFLQPRVSVPEQYAAECSKYNKDLVHIANVFDPSLHEFLVKHAKAIYDHHEEPSKQVLFSITPTNDHANDGIGVAAALKSCREIDREGNGHLADNPSARLSQYTMAATVLSTYLVEIALLKSDTSPFENVLGLLKTILGSHPDVASSMITALQDDRALARTLRHNSSSQSHAVLSLQYGALKALEMRDVNQYESAYKCLLTFCGQQINSHSIDFHPELWHCFVEIICTIAEWGGDELDTILQGAFLEWAIDVLQAQRTQKPRKFFCMFGKVPTPCLNALFNLVNRLIIAISVSDSDEDRARRLKTIPFMWPTLTGAERPFLPWLRMVPRQRWAPSTLQSFAPADLVQSLNNIGSPRIMEMIYDTLLDSVADGHHVVAMQLLVTAFVNNCPDVQQCTDMLEKYIATTAEMEADSDDAGAVLQCLCDVVDHNQHAVAANITGWVWVYEESSEPVAGAALGLLRRTLDISSPIDSEDTHDADAPGPLRIRQVAQVLQHCADLARDRNGDSFSSYASHVARIAMAFAKDLHTCVTEIFDAIDPNDDSGADVMSSEVLAFIQEAEAASIDLESAMRNRYNYGRRHSSIRSMLSAPLVNSQEDDDDGYERDNNEEEEEFAFESVDEE